MKAFKQSVRVCSSDSEPAPEVQAEQHEWKSVFQCSEVYAESKRSQAQSRARVRLVIYALALATQAVCAARTWTVRHGECTGGSKQRNAFYSVSF